jgi:hypothetical protein
MKKEDKKSEENDSIFKKLEEMDNKLERIKSDTHNLNRIACISNSRAIIQELKKAVGRSEIRAAILHFTKDEISVSDLVQALGIKGENLAMYMKPFLGNRGIIAEIKRGRNKYFQRSELVDIVGFEKEEDFIELIKSWEESKRKKEEKTATSVPPKEDKNVTQL